MADTSAPAPAGTIEEQRDALRDKQAQAQREAEATAARLTLLDTLVAGEQAWSAAKEQFLADLAAVWDQVKDCPDTLAKALGEQSGPLGQARDRYDTRVGELAAALTARQDAARAADVALTAAGQTLQDAQDAFTARFGDVTAAMTARLGALADLVTRLKAVMGATPCDAATAYLLALDIADEHRAIADAAGADLAQETAKALAEIAKRQAAATEAAAAKTAADAAVVAAQAELTAAVDDRYGTIIAIAAAEAQGRS